MAEIIIPVSGLQRYGFADPASAKGKIRKTRARQAIVIIGVDHLARIYTLFAWAGRLQTSKFIDKILSVCEKYTPRAFGIEANAMQSLFADVVQDKAKQSWRKAPIRAIHVSTKVDKDFRIRSTLEPVIAEGRLFVLEKQIEMISEIRGFPTGLTKDIIDCLASAISMAPKRRYRSDIEDEVDALASYLRETGAPAHYIQQRVEEMRGEWENYGSRVHPEDSLD